MSNFDNTNSQAQCESQCKSIKIKTCHTTLLSDEGKVAKNVSCQRVSLNSMQNVNNFTDLELTTSILSSHFFIYTLLLLFLFISYILVILIYILRTLFVLRTSPFDACSVPLQTTPA